MSSSIYEQIKSRGNLPSPNGVALELMRLADDPAATIEQVTRTVEADPALASQLLKLVNSPVAGAARKVVSLSMAVRLLGIRTARNLALSVSLLGSSAKGVSRAFDFERFWTESFARAAAARSLADLFASCAPDEAFAIGLLSRIGRLGLACAFANAYDAILDRVSSDSSNELLQCEFREFGIDQNELTAEMLADWGIASIFCDAVRHQDRADALAHSSDGRAASIARLLQLAGVVGSVMVDSEVYSDDLIRLANTAKQSGIETSEFSRRFELLRDEWPEAALIFSVRAQKVPSLREMHTRASRDHCNVLVVDDDPAVLRLLDKLLSDAGYHVQCAANGREAYELIHTDGLQLVITDWNMPEMDGLELCRAIRGSEGAGFVYLIMMTGHVNEDSLAMAFEAGADDFLPKPCNKQELLSRLKAGVRAVASDASMTIHHRAIAKANAELAVLNERLNKLASTDALTGLHNRREAINRLEELWSLSNRSMQPMACILLDIDHFKKCNDTYGHDAGDAVLRETARVMAKSARKGERVYRLGGEEFLVICPDANEEMAVVGAERIRAAVEANSIQFGDNVLSVTISAGVAAKTAEIEHSDYLLKRADEALYAAKQAGRNAVHRSGAMVSHGARRIRDEKKARIAPVGHDRATESVLVVDDDLSTRRLFRKILESDGFNVIEAKDGNDALTKVREVPIAVIIMDVEMPIMDGIECTKRLKSDPATESIPIIIVSGNADESEVVAGLGAGAEEFVSKPVRHTELLLRIRSMSRLQRTRNDVRASNAVRGEQARAMTILFEYSRSLAMASGVDEIVTRTVTTACELLNCGRVSLMLPDDDRSSLIVAGSIGVSDQLRASIRIPVGAGVAGRVFESGNQVICNEDSEQSGRSDRYESAFFASAPLVSSALTDHDVVVGVLNLTERHDRQPFTDHEIEYVHLLCNLAGAAIEQARAEKARQSAYGAVVVGLAKLAEHRDADTGRHLDRVTEFSLTLAGALRDCPQFAKTIDDQFLDDLKLAMPLHDIGKVSTPDSILSKSGKLTADEFETIKLHTSAGAAVIEAVMERSQGASFLTMARDIVHYHHERFDGTGYPAGIKGNDIPLAARIAAVADVYDALRSERPYKDAMPHAVAVKKIKEGSGSHFDPEVVRAFVQVEKEFARLAMQLTDNDCSSPPVEMSVSKQAAPVG